MASSDAAQLVVRLEARLDEFERSLKQAGSLADDEVGKMEDRFRKANTIGSTIGTTLGTGLSKAISAGISLLEDMFDRFKRINESAELAGVSVKQAFAIDKLLGSGALAGFDKIGTLLDRAQRGEENYLSKLFDANGVKNVKDALSAFDKVVDLIQRAPNEYRAREIGKGVGLDEDTVKKIREAGNEFTELREKAAASAPDLDKLAQQAKDFDEAWSRAVKAVKSYLVDEFHAMAVPVAEFVEGAIDSLKTLLEGIRSVGSAIAGVTGGNTSALDQDIGRLDAAKKAIREFIDARAPLEVNVRKGGPSKPAPVDKDKSSSSDRLDSFEREERRATETAAKLDAETASLDKNTLERTKALETLRLEQMLKREEIEIDADYARRIDETASKIAKATATYEQARRVQGQRLELENFAGQQLVDALDGAILRGEKLNEVFANVVQSLAKAALQAAILGNGPLAGVFGTSSDSSSKTGGLIGLISTGIKSIGANADGTDNWRGGLSLVGERGPELVNLPRGAQVIPNDITRNISMPQIAVPLARGGGRVTLTLGDTHIDARGSTMSEAQFRSILTENNRQLAASLPAMVTNARRRGQI